MNCTVFDTPEATTVDVQTMGVAGSVLLKLACQSDRVPLLGGAEKLPEAVFIPGQLRL